jgi:pimeloyl-[acyl-carrier protein] methyl ester esterase
MGGDVAPKRLVLLPGLDGTGQLFADFLAALPVTLIATVVSYPPERFLSYADLLPFVSAAAPRAEPFALLAESFSTPIALRYAVTNPPNLAAVVICAGFVFKPIGGWSWIVKRVAKPWIFRLRPPRRILEDFLIGSNAPQALIQKLRQALRIVSPAVLSRRVREALDCDARNDLARTTVPIMYMQAAHDRLLAEYCRTEIFRMRPDITCAVVQGPHLILQREPQKAANLVATFVGQLGAGARSLPSVQGRGFPSLD